MSDRPGGPSPVDGPPCLLNLCLCHSLSKVGVLRAEVSSSDLPPRVGPAMPVKSLEVGALRFRRNEATLCGCGDLDGRTGNRSRLVVGMTAEGQESVFGSESLEWERSWESWALPPPGEGASSSWGSGADSWERCCGAS